MRLIQALYKMKKGALLLILVALNMVSLAQEGYKKVDSTTFSHYEAKQWKELVSYGKENQLDYYYFNARIGEAYFHLKQYLSAEKYFTKALVNNETEEIKTFLFWTYLYMGERNLAEQTFDELTAKTQDEIGYTTQALEQFYLEGGIKSPSEDTIGTMYYGTLFLKHRIGKNIKMGYSITPFTLKSDVFEATNRQFNILGSYYLGKKSVISLGGMFSKMDFTENFTNFDIPTNQPFFIVDEVTKGKRNYSTNSYYINYHYRMNRWKFNVNLNFTNQKVESTEQLTQKRRFRSNDYQLQDLIKISDSSYTENVFTPSIGVKYAPSILKDRVSFGVVLFGLTSKKEVELVIKPSISALLTDKIWVEASYFEVSERLFSDYTTSIFYNTYQPTKRFASTLSFMISPKFILKGTYSFEQVENLNYGFNYTLNSAYLGLQINL